MRNWLIKQKRGNKASRFSRLPLMEEALYDEHKEVRAQGEPIKQWWFNARAKQLVVSDETLSRKIIYSF